MNKFLTPQAFFDLGSFEHRSLFEKGQSVWDALSHLASYLKTLPLGKISVAISPHVYLSCPEQISIGEGTVIEPGAFIQGPCVIGKNCQIRHGAYIRGNVLIGDRCIVGHTTEVKNTIFLNDVTAAHFNYIGDSILGNLVNLGAGAKCANLRLDRGVVSVRIEGKKVVTGLKKLGAILGDGCQIGCNCVLNPGTFFGKGGVSFPCVNVHGYIPEGKKII